MWCTVALVVFLTISFSTNVNSQLCRITPQRGINAQRLQGAWSQVMLYRPGRSEEVVPKLTDIHWIIEPDRLTRNSKIRTVARNAKHPHDCINIPGVLMPTNVPGFIKYRSPLGDIGAADFLITHTDYRSYMIIAGCKPKIEEGCKEMVVVLSRRQLGPRDRLFLHILKWIIERRICIEPKKFSYSLYTAQGIAGCLAPPVQTNDNDSD